MHVANVFNLFYLKNIVAVIVSDNIPKHVFSLTVARL